MSIVFGTPTTGNSCSAWSRAATPSVSSPPIATSASSRSRSNVASTRSTPSSLLYGFVRDVPMIVPPRGRIPEISRGPSAVSRPSTRPAPARTHPQHLVAAVERAPRDCADDGVQAGAIAPAGEDRDAVRHRLTSRGERRLLPHGTGWSGASRMPKAGIEPARGQAPLDFESSASSSSATSAKGALPPQKGYPSGLDRCGLRSHNRRTEKRGCCGPRQSNDRDRCTTDVRTLVECPSRNANHVGGGR